MIEIPLTKGYKTLVNYEDVCKIMFYSWSLLKCKSTNYAIGKINGIPILLHRYLLNVSNDLEVDHIDHNGLNNQRINLRIGTKKDNQHNRGSRKGTSIYKGVSFRYKIQKWQSRIKINNIEYNLGFFDNEVEAALAYDKEAIKLHGEFALLNFQPTVVRPDLPFME